MSYLQFQQVWNKLTFPHGFTLADIRKYFTLYFFFFFAESESILSPVECVLFKIVVLSPVM